MTSNEINISLVGKKVSVMVTGMRVNGIITGIWEDEYATGVRVKHEPVQWGEDSFTTLLSTARKCDNAGNLKYTELI